jgi:hypothetical protein
VRPVAERCLGWVAVLLIVSGLALARDSLGSLVVELFGADVGWLRENARAHGLAIRRLDEAFGELGRPQLALSSSVFGLREHWHSLDRLERGEVEVFEPQPTLKTIREVN